MISRRKGDSLRVVYLSGGINRQILTSPELKFFQYNNNKKKTYVYIKLATIRETNK